MHSPRLPKDQIAMAKGIDREHFENYREQTQVKHDILAAYLPAYYHILKRWSKNLVYIDGFAGPGRYLQSTTGETFDGSPIQALRLIAKNELFQTGKHNLHRVR